MGGTQPGPPLRKCAVVVDSRNMRGQARKVFGWPRQPSVQGVRAALLGYGLDAQDIYVGVATRTTTRRPSNRLVRSLETNAAYRDQLVADGASVLEGLLVERGDRIEEKQVDVLCAVQVCDIADHIATKVSGADCVVLLSEDMDLMPAFELAQRRGVTAYAGAFDTIYQRDQQRDWLILDEPAMTSLVAPVGRHVGLALRAKLAAIATADVRTAARWTLHAPLGDGLFLMRGGLGAAGVWTPGFHLSSRHKADLFPQAIEIDPEGGRFPRLVLGSEPPAAGPLDGIEMAELLYWQSPTSARVSLKSGDLATLRMAPGSALPGQSLAVLRAPAGREIATYFVGPLSPRPKVAGWSSSDHRTLVTLSEEPSARGWVEARAEGTGERVFVHARHLNHATRGTRLLVALAGELEVQGVPTVMPLTCCLP